MRRQCSDAGPSASKVLLMGAQCVSLEHASCSQFGCDACRSSKSATSSQPPVRAAKFTDALEYALPQSSAASSANDTPHEASSPRSAPVDSPTALRKKQVGNPSQGESTSNTSAPEAEAFQISDNMVVSIGGMCDDSCKASTAAGAASDSDTTASSARPQEVTVAKRQPTASGQPPNREKETGDARIESPLPSQARLRRRSFGGPLPSTKPAGKPKGSSCRSGRPPLSPQCKASPKRLARRHTDPSLPSSQCDSPEKDWHFERLGGAGADASLEYSATFGED